MRWLGRGVLASLVTVVSMVALPPRGEAGALGLDVLAGMNLPMGDAGDGLSAGVSGGVRGHYRVAPAFALGLVVAGDFPGFKDSAVRELNDLVAYEVSSELLAAGATNISIGTDLDPSISVIQFGLDATWTPPTQGRTKPFLRVGGAMYNIGIGVKGTVAASYQMGGTPYSETVPIDETHSESKFGVSLAAGVLHHAWPVVAVGLEAGYHNVFKGLDDETSLQQLRMAALLSFSAAD